MRQTSLEGSMSEHVTTPEAISDYLLGNTDEEHSRLIRQAARLAPVTEAFFREAGIGAGQRILDVGSGLGDVAMLLARLVGPTGAVVGVERDAKSIARAKARAMETRLFNICFVEGDIADCALDGAFDAVVGRYVLQFLPDPAGVLRRLSQSLRRGGIAAFLECSFAPFLALSAHLPLWSTAARLMQEVGLRHGVRTEMGPELFRTFIDAGLPAPHMRLYMELGHDQNFTRWLADVLRSIRPHFSKFQISPEPLGNLDTLEERLQAEVASSRSVVPWLSMVGACARR
jgi:ubiquinone/menaquinone biosynthesis C-methylase UbiE